MNANTNRLAGDLKAVVRDAEAILKDTAEEVGEKAHEAREKLTQAIEQAKACCQNMEKKTVAGARAVDQTVHEHPYQAMGVAFGVGILAGYLITRK